MNRAEALSKIQGLHFPLFRTADVATLLKKNVDAANKILSRLAPHGFCFRLSKGLWALPQADPYLLPEYLSAPFLSYVSLQSALYLHGMISQIPETIYAVSLGRTRIIKTPLATISLHHIQPDFFFGYAPEGKQGIKLASPEKALLDIFYLTPSKSRLFVNLPELEAPKNFSVKEAQAMIRRIPSPARKSLVQARFDHFYTTVLKHR